jgi:hypothetical protein
MSYSCLFLSENTPYITSNMHWTYNRYRKELNEDTLPIVVIVMLEAGSGSSRAPIPQNPREQGATEVSLSGAFFIRYIFNPFLFHKNMHNAKLVAENMKT